MIGHYLDLIITANVTPVVVDPHNSGGPDAATSERRPLPEVAGRRYHIPEAEETKPEETKLRAQLDEIAHQIEEATPENVPVLSTKYTEVLLAQMHYLDAVSREAELVALREAQRIDEMALAELQRRHMLLSDDEAVAMNIAALLLRRLSSS